MRSADILCNTHHASPYFPFLSSGDNLSPEKQKRHDMIFTNYLRRRRSSVVVRWQATGNWHNWHVQATSNVNASTYIKMSQEPAVAGLSLFYFRPREDSRTSRHLQKIVLLRTMVAITTRRTLMPALLMLAAGLLCCVVSAVSVLAAC